MDKIKKFAENLKALRKERGWSQQELALKIHYTNKSLVNGRTRKLNLHSTLFGHTLKYLRLPLTS